MRNIIVIASERSSLYENCWEIATRTPENFDFSVRVRNDNVDICLGKWDK